MDRLIECIDIVTCPCHFRDDPSAGLFCRFFGDTLPALHFLLRIIKLRHTAVALEKADVGHAAFHSFLKDIVRPVISLGKAAQQGHFDGRFRIALFFPYDLQLSFPFFTVDKPALIIRTISVTHRDHLSGTDAKHSDVVGISSPYINHTAGQIGPGNEKSRHWMFLLF